MSEDKRPKRLSLLRELRDHGPIGFVALMAVALINYEVTNVYPERYAAAGLAMWKFALTAAIPVFWVLVYYYFRARDSRRLKQRWAVYGAIAAVMAGLPLAIYFFGRPSYLPDKTIVFYYEAAQFAWLALLVAHCLYARGPAQTVLFFGVGFLYGLALENMGIIVGYFGESQYRMYLGLGQKLYLPAPLATQVGWCIMFYVAVWVAEYIGGKLPWLRRCPVRMALFTSLLAVTLDMQIDPLASLSGLWWKWNPRLPALFLGVPLLNFVAWFAAFLPFSLAYFFCRRDERLTDWRRTGRLLLLVPWLLPACLLVGGLIMAIAEGGFSGPTYRIALEFWHRIMPY